MAVPTRIKIVKRAKLRRNRNRGPGRPSAKAEPAFDRVEVPRYSEPPSGRAVAGDDGRMRGEGVVPDTIQSRNPVEIHFGVAQLDSRLQGVLDEVPTFLSQTSVHKKQFGVTDLSRLTAATGDEFALFSRGSERLIIRGDAGGVNLSPSAFVKLKEQGYRWSGHSHPGASSRFLQASGDVGGIAKDGDRFVLQLMDQKQSLILNSAGQRNVFDLFGERVIEK